jgi:cell wall-associated NlpC family hydrolase
MSGPALAAAAQALAGTPFRLNGRDPATGLDCLGVLATALAAIGQPAAFPSRYSLRQREGIDAAALARVAGLTEAASAIRAGDVLLVRCSPVQRHVLVALGADRVVHAHAGLRRVVIGPRDGGWALIGHWRLPDPS